MANTELTIDRKGKFSPNGISPNPGDTVTFTAPDFDVVLLVETPAVFGGVRYEIPAGASLKLPVKDDAIHVQFAMVAFVLNPAGDTRGGDNKTGP